MNATVKNLLAEIAALKSRLETAEYRAMTAENEREDIRRQRDSMEAARDTMLGEARQWMEYHDQWKAKAEAAEKERDEISAQAQSDRADMRTLANEVKRLNSRIETAEKERDDEREIVNRIWAIFGTPSYEDLKGRSIYDLINEVIGDRDRANARIQTLSCFRDAAEEKYDTVLDVLNDKLVDIPEDNEAAKRVRQMMLRGAHSEDRSRLDWLGAQLAHPNYWKDIVLAWDATDGIWLARIPRGEWDALPLETSAHQPTLRAAIDAARLAK